jgi:hypothetical protein
VIRGSGAKWHAGNSDSARKFGLRDAEFSENFGEEFSRMDCRKSAARLHHVRRKPIDA